MGFAAFRPSRAVRRLRRKPGFIDLRQFNLPRFRLLDQVGDLTFGAGEALWITLFFKL